MIKNLLIENFIIVRKTELQFTEGLQVLTGETGAGKSVIAGAIDLVLGGKIKTEILFNEELPAKLEIEFTIDNSKVEFVKILKGYGIDDLSEGLFITREISVAGKSRFFLNGRRVSSLVILELREYLIDFHSQRDQQKLFDNNYQLEIIDFFADLSKKKEHYSDLYKKTVEKIKHLKFLESAEKEKKDKIKLFEYQISEIKTINLQINEDDKLEKEANLINHAVEIINLSTTMEQRIYESDNSIYDVLNSFIHQLQDYENDNDRIKNCLDNLKSSIEMLDESVNEIREMPNIIDFDVERLHEIETRLDAINRLKLKYKMNIEEIILYKDKIEKDLSDFDNQSEEIENLKIEINGLLSSLLEKSKSLSKKRQEKAKLLERNIEKNIRKLAIPDAKVEFKFIRSAKDIKEAKIENFSVNGVDEVEIMFSANKGKKIQPLKLAASGGELSRFLLTVKKVMSDKLEKRTIIFDEIDSGIGGQTANLLGDFIKNISQYHQIVCISHLAQIAAFAQNHFAIGKKTVNNRTELVISELNDTERRKEIARMLSGSKSELALKYADEILNRQELAQ